MKFGKYCKDYSFGVLFSWKLLIYMIYVSVCGTFDICYIHVELLIC